MGTGSAVPGGEGLRLSVKGSRETPPPHLPLVSLAEEEERRQA